MGIAPVQVQVLSYAVNADKVIGDDDLFLFSPTEERCFRGRKIPWAGRRTDAFYTFEKILRFFSKKVLTNLFGWVIIVKHTELCGCGGTGRRARFRF